MRARACWLIGCGCLAGVISVGGCSALIGLDERHLAADSGGSDGPTASGDGAATSDAGPGDDGSSDAAALDDAMRPTPCTVPGPAILAFAGNDDAWRYDTSSALVPIDFVRAGVFARLIDADDSSNTAFMHRIFMRRASGQTYGDHIVTLDPNEGGLAYETLSSMWPVFIGVSSPPLGTIEINRVKRFTAPLRHKLVIGQSLPAGGSTTFPRCGSGRVPPERPCATTLDGVM